jgi:hypothetical protein
MSLNDLIIATATSLVSGGVASAAFWALAKDKLRDTFVTKDSYAQDERLREAVIVKPLQEMVEELKVLSKSNSENTTAVRLLTERLPPPSPRRKRESR